MGTTEKSYLVYNAAGAYMGMAPLMEQAVGAAKAMAKRSGSFADVVRVVVTENETTTRRCRYHADGTVEQLWKDKENQRKVIVRPRVVGEPGVIAMPMKKNVEHGRPGWRLVPCPVCGRECWQRPEQIVAMELEPQLQTACTECALAVAMGKKGSV